MSRRPKTPFTIDSCAVECLPQALHENNVSRNLMALVDQGQQVKPFALRPSLPLVKLVTVLASRVKKYVITLSDLRVNPWSHFATNLAVQFIWRIKNEMYMRVVNQTGTPCTSKYEQVSELLTKVHLQSTFQQKFHQK